MTMTTLDRAAFRLPRLSGPAAVLAGTGALLGGLALAVNAYARRAEANHPPIGCLLDVDGVRVHYLERGEGRPLVLLHGPGLTLDDFAISVLDRLARSYRVVLLDRPGFGYSERPKRCTWTPLRQAHLLRRTLDRLGVAHPIVLGHSFAALVAMAYGLAYPEATAGLVLESGYYYPTARRDIPLFAAPALPVVGPVLRHTFSPVLGAVLLPGLIRRLFAPNPVPANFSRFPVSLTLRPGHLRADAEDSAAIQGAAAQMARCYRSLAVPVRILAGESDRFVSTHGQSTRLYREIPHASIRIVERTGHMLHHVRPDAVEESVEVVREEAEAAG
jgi:pimeloyl-ACP methyl ester carboxylesterase